MQLRVCGAPHIKLINIVKSWKPDKKFVALFEVDGRSRNVHFGSATSQTYVEGADEKKRNAYIKRHSALNEDWDNPITPGSLSKWILWTEPNINDAIKAFIKKYNL
jgi:hypothetical protein